MCDYARIINFRIIIIMIAQCIYLTPHQDHVQSIGH